MLMTPEFVIKGEHSVRGWGCVAAAIRQDQNSKSNMVAETKEKIYTPEKVILRHAEGNWFVLKNNKFDWREENRKVMEQYHRTIRNSFRRGMQGGAGGGGGGAREKGKAILKVQVAVGNIFWGGHAW